jgi:hypothetical protein
LEDAVSRSSKDEAEFIPGIGLSADGVPINRITMIEANDQTLFER